MEKVGRPTTGEKLVKKAKRNLADARSIKSLDYLDIIHNLIAFGCTEKDVGLILGMKGGRNAIANLKHSYPEMKALSKDAKSKAKQMVLAEALRCAIGYEYETKRVKVAYDAKGSVKGSEEITFLNHQPPNANMISFLLTNFDRSLGQDEFQAMHRMEVNSNKTLKLEVGKPERDKIKELAGKLLSPKLVKAEIIEPDS